MAAKDNIKVVLLFQPQKLLMRRPVLQLLKVQKLADTVEMDDIPITTATVNLYFKHLDLDARRILFKFSNTELDEESVTLESMLLKMNTSKDEFEAKLERNWARHYQQQLGRLRSYGNKLSWYHRVPAAGSNRLRTSPCTYHPLGVWVNFEAGQGKKGIELKATVHIQGRQQPLDTFRRYHFLLEQNNAYWHLNMDTYEALEWLESINIKDYNKDAETFIREVAEPLRSYRQKVDTEAIMPKEQLVVQPGKRVLLSELNNTFLMLTPQFVYDGWVVDGPFSPVANVQHLNKPIEIVRNAQFEKEFTAYLQALHPNFSAQRNGYFYLKFADAQKKHWFLKVYHQLLEADVELLGMDLLQHFRYSPYKPETTITQTGQTETQITLKLKLAFGKEVVPLPELQKMLLSGQKALLLKDGTLGVLGDDWLARYSLWIKHGKVKKDTLSIARWMAFSQEEEAHNSDAAAPQILPRTISAEWWQKWKHWQQSDSPVYSLPPQVQVQALRSYQQKGYDWMNILAEAGGSACLADDMGLGKTLQTICFMANRLHTNPEGRHLVICPASLIYNWVQEFEKFAAGIKTMVYHGPGRQAEQLTDANANVIITSYGTMRQDVEQIAAVVWDVIVLDESHSIKNPSAQITRAVGALQGATRIALSGTPVMNSTADLYAQVNFLLPGLLGSYEFFRREYAIPIEQKQDAEKAAALQKLIGPFVLRRTKEQVATDLPPKTEMIMWCEMGKDQQAAYESVKENIRSNVFLEIEQQGLQKGKMSILAGLTRLRQLCNSCELVTTEDLFTYDSIKTEILLQELQGLITHHKVLVFSQFTGMLKLLQRDLTKAGITWQQLDGSTAIGERQELVNNFQQEDSEARVFLLSLKAGNAGLNITAADYVFLFDPWWNAAVENQAIDRTHRIGQNKQVFVYRMICKNTVEEKIMKLQGRKQKMASELVSTDESFMKALTMEDVKYLLE